MNAATPFHLYLDSADLAALRASPPHPVVHGVTTNPTLMRRAGLTRDALPGLLHAALVAVSDMRLLVASVRSRAAYLALLRIGVGAITIPPALLAELLDHPATQEAERGFLADAQGHVHGQAAAQAQAQPVAAR